MSERRKGMPEAKQLAAWLSRLDRHPPAFPATLAALGGFGASAALLSSDSIPKVASFTAIAALGAAAGWLAQKGEPLLEVEKPLPKKSLTQGLWVDIPGGSFLMGSPPLEKDRGKDEGPQHEVELSPFQMMRVPVTRELYRQVVGHDPGWPTEGASLPERPINNVSWYDALHFCNALSALEGRQPAYAAADGSSGPFAERSRVSWNRSADGYCLPTEAQWEYACRAGSKTRFCFGDEETQLLDYAWYDANSDGKTQPVGRKKANAWGLYDLHGNVWEWCWDNYAPYVAEKMRDPAGPEDRSVLRPVVRGGSYWNGAGWLRSACRDSTAPAVAPRGRWATAGYSAGPLRGPERCGLHDRNHGNLHGTTYRRWPGEDAGSGEGRVASSTNPPHPGGVPHRSRWLRPVRGAPPPDLWSAATGRPPPTLRTPEGCRNVAGGCGPSAGRHHRTCGPSAGRAASTTNPPHPGGVP